MNRNKTIFFGLILSALLLCFVSFDDPKTTYSNLYFERIKLFQNSLQHLENDLQQQNFSAKKTQSKQVLFFQTACKMTSPRSIVAGLVSAKKPMHTTT